MVLLSPSPRAESELTLLDGRYQLLRQLSGPPRAPLMVASDLETGRVVCIRLRQFCTARANLTAVPLLTLDSHPAGDGPLLPFDFGVDDGTAYLVRDFVTATSLQDLLAAPDLPSALDIVTILRRAGDALLNAAGQGFHHPGLALRHLLVAADGTIRVSGYDNTEPHPQRGDAGEAEQLAALLSQAFADQSPTALPPPVRALLTRCKTWLAGKGPDLEGVVRHLRRCEEQLQGYSRLGEALSTTTHVAAALFRRFRHLGPLLHPYLVVLTLVIAIGVLAARALAAPANPGRLLIYPIPTRASDESLMTYPFASPPKVLTSTTRVQTGVATATSIAAEPTVPSFQSTTDSTVSSRAAPNDAAPVRQEAAVSRETPAVVLPPPVRRIAAAPPIRATVSRITSTTAPNSKALTSQSAPAEAKSTVIVTSLTAQATTARVTIIAATSERSSVSAPEP
ncbi:MAG: hypothetical protein ACR2JY_22810, partial [Chloroflexota bacterium]